MVTGEFSYFFIREVAFSLHQEAAQNDPALLPLLRAPLGQDLVQRCAASVVASSRRHVHGAYFSFTVCGSKELKDNMTPEHASFDVFTELLRRRPVPGWQRREAERQATFEARYCDTETDYRSTETEEDSEQEEQEA